MELQQEPAAVQRSLAVTSTEEVTIQKNVLTLQAQATTLTITDDASLAAAVAFGGNVKQLAKKVEEDRKKLMAPLKQVVDEINGRYKGTLETLASVEAEVKTKVGAYQSEQIRKQREAEAAARREEEERRLAQAAEVERLRKEQEAEIAAKAKAESERLAAEGKAEEAAKVEETAQQQVAATHAAAERIIDQRLDLAPTKSQVSTVARGGGFSSGISQRWDYEVVDIAKVPAEFLDVKAGPLRTKMNEMAKDGGTPSLPGIRFFQKDVVSFR